MTLTAAGVGFVAAVFFCVGNVFNSPSSIVAQATPFWDFSEPVARSLVAQRSQYIVGAALLVAAFAFQVAAALVSREPVLWFPAALQDWTIFLMALIGSVTIIATVVAVALYYQTMKKVLSQAKKQTAGT
jgi:hypothetical protein